MSDYEAIRRQLALNTLAEYDRAWFNNRPFYPDLIHNLADHLSHALGIPSYPERVRAADATAQQTAAGMEARS